MQRNKQCAIGDDTQWRTFSFFMEKAGEVNEAIEMFSTATL